MSRWWLVALLMPVTIATGCSSSQSDPPGAMRAVTVSVIDSVIVPPGSREVAWLGEPGLRRPEQSSACNPLVDHTRFWTDRSTLSKVDSFLMAHPERGSVVRVSGSFSSPDVKGDFEVDVPSDYPRNNQSELVFTFVNIGIDNVGIRADAESVPHGATCVSSGGSSAP